MYSEEEAVKGGRQETRVAGPALLQTASPGHQTNLCLIVLQQPYLLKYLNWSKTMLLRQSETKYACFSHTANNVSNDVNYTTYSTDRVGTWLKRKRNSLVRKYTPLGHVGN